ncbi:hypothetical protein Mal48_38760 [Thalassoglobus polymorphus]|uniref:Uncharacterized protein n=1 Tax=Thalassoglobus polymorphus TaxID=2527994 RepID=A0A517QSM3_9PLAN|nr:hypothetical protein Mal48_38760 [Thalassoglobus polymorphus]
MTDSHAVSDLLERMTLVVTNGLLEQFALPCAREERISLVKVLFATRQILQTNSKNALDFRSIQDFWVCFSGEV